MGECIEQTIFFIPYVSGNRIRLPSNMDTHLEKLLGKKPLCSTLSEA